MRTAIFGLLAIAGFVSATEAQCLNNNFDELISKTSCGCPKKLSRCLGGALDLTRSDQIQRCFTASGCEEEDAITSAVRFAYECQRTENSEVQDELRKRQDDDESTTRKGKGRKTTEQAAETTADDQSTEAAETTSEKADKTTEAAKTTETPETTAPSSADATTTADNPTTTPDSTASTTPASTTSDSQITAATAASEITGSTTSLQCSVTNMVTTSVCSTDKDGKKLGCTPTITPSATCAPGVICQVDGHGNPVCLKKDNHLTTSGVAVTIIFVIGILGATAAIFIANYQSRSANRKKEVERTALLSGTYARNVGKARAVDVEASQSYQQRNPSEANIPLISPGGTRSDQAYQHPYNTDYFNAPGGSNSVSPNEGRGGAPKLHPGLGALGQDYR